MACFQNPLWKEEETNRQSVHRRAVALTTTHAAQGRGKQHCGNRFRLQFYKGNDPGSYYLHETLKHLCGCVCSSRNKGHTIHPAYPSGLLYRKKWDTVCTGPLKKSLYIHDLLKNSVKNKTGFWNTLLISANTRGMSCLWQYSKFMTRWKYGLPIKIFSILFSLEIIV